MLLGLPEFDVLRANTIAEACALLSKYGDEARVLAGGTDLLVKMKNKATLPRYLINVKRIPNLDQIGYEEPAGLRIGALTTIQAIKDSSVIAHYFPMLSQAAGKVGTLQIRNLGTIGGNLANASPAAEFAPVLLTLSASVKCAGPDGERMIAMDKFFLGPGKTSLRGNEMLTEIVVPNLPPHAAGIYLKHSLRGMDVAIVSAAVVIHLDGEVCRDAKIALGAVAPTPFRARKAEALLNGRTLRGSDDDNELFDEVARVAAGESVPIDDLRAYTTYRKKVAENLSRQGLEQAIALAR
jgi:CO/xanthine dehydrogenase FAD-binding subunit